MKILILSDGKPGHENQSCALAEAIERRVSTTQIEVHPYLDWRAVSFKPQLVISAGHRTHWSLLAAKWHYQAPAIVLMKPSLQLALFDFVVAPRHDFARGQREPNVIITEGMLCRLPEVMAEKVAQEMILVGGPSKHSAGTHR